MNIESLILGTLSGKIYNTASNNQIIDADELQAERQPGTAPTSPSLAPIIIARELINRGGTAA